MNKYRIFVNNSYSKIVLANSPKEALEKVYNQRLNIIDGTRFNATHKVELLDGGRQSINYYTVLWNYATRKQKPSNYIEPMPKSQLRRIIKAFKKQGGDVVMNKECDEMLDKRGLSGITYNSKLVLLHTNPSRSTVFEEFIHTYQYRVGKNDGSLLLGSKCEVEAKEKLLKYKEVYKITDNEDKLTRKLLEQDKKAYNYYKNR